MKQVCNLAFGRIYLAFKASLLPEEKLGIKLRFCAQTALLSNKKKKSSFSAISLLTIQ